MSEIVLINPGASQAIYQGLADEFTAVEPPAWLRMIAGWLRNNDYSVAIIDQEAEGLSHQEVARRVKEFSPLLIAIVVVGHQPSASTQQMAGASALAKVLPGLVIMVGHHPSALPERTLSEENVSYVCDGEGPLTLASLLNGDPLEDVPGLVWRQRDNVRKNPRAPLLHINELAGNVWDLLPMERYRAHNWQCLDGSDRSPYASIYTTLGCPFKCSFCMINVFQHTNRYRMRSPKSVVAEIEMLYADYGVRTIKIADEMFVLNERHVREICEGLAAKSFVDELNIWAYARIDTVKSGQPEVLRRAGIRWLALGIESGSAHVRDGTDKTFSETDIFAVVRMIQDAGINVIGNFIFGLPDDTHETMRATFNLASNLNCEFANFYSAMAYPGSKLYDRAPRIDLPKEWSGYSQHSIDCTPLRTATLTSFEVLNYRDSAFAWYFGSEIYRSMVKNKFGVKALDHIDSMAEMSLSRTVTSITGLDHLEGETIKVLADGYAHHDS